MGAKRRKATGVSYTAAMPADRDDCAEDKRAAFRGMEADVICTLRCFDPPWHLAVFGNAPGAA
jgi:hypothetical protein